MPASAPAHSHPHAVALRYASSANDSDESEFPAASTVNGPSMQGRDQQRLIKLEKVCTEKLTGKCSLFDPNVIGSRGRTGRQQGPRSGDQDSEGEQCEPSDASYKGSKFT
jgi:hypothetical protein